MCEARQVPVLERPRHAGCRSGLRSALLLLSLAASLTVPFANRGTIRDLRFEFSPSPPPYVSETALAGVSNLSPGAVYDPAAGENAIRNLYALRVFKQVEIYTETRPDGLSVTLRLYPHPLVGEIRWDGVTFFKTRSLARAVGVVPGMVLTHEARSSFLSRLRQEYAKKGFPDVRARCEWVESPRGGALTFSVSEGKRRVVRRAEAERVGGDLLPDIALFLDRLKLKPFDQAKVDRLARVVESEYHRRGWPAATVETINMPGEADDSTTPVFLVESGPKTEVSVTGCTLSQKTLRQKLALYRLADVSEFAEEQSREDIRALLESLGLMVDGVTSTRRVREDRTLEIRFAAVTLGKRPRTKLSLAGNKAFSKREILSGTKLQEGGALAGIDAGVAAEKILQFYRDRGYKDARCDVVEVASPTARLLTATVADGPPSVLGRVSMAFPEGGVPPGLDGSLSAWGGRAFTVEAAAGLRANVTNSFGSIGRQVERIHLDESAGETGRVDVSIRVEAAPPLRLDRVVTVGKLRTRPEKLRRMVSVQEGSFLDQASVYRMESGLYSSGVFEHVETFTPPVAGRPGHRNLVVNLRESPRYTLGYGVGYQEFEGVRGMLDISDSNFLGRGQVMGILFRGSRKKALAQWSFHDDTLLFDRLPLDLSAYIEYQDRVSFASRKMSFAAQTSRPVFRNSTMFFQLGFENIRNTDINDQPGPVPTRDELPITLPFMSSTLVHDTRDSPTDPEKGALTTASATLAPRLFGAKTGFLKVFMQEQFYRTVADGVVFAGSIRLGSIFTLAGSDPTPISERFFAGGSSTLRGYSVDKAGPLDPDTHAPVGGDALVIANAEIRFPVRSNLTGALFYDTGNVFAEISAVRWPDFTHTVGAGLRFKTPIGPVRLDVGYSLKPVPYDRRYQVFVTIGNPF